MALLVLMWALNCRAYWQLEGRGWDAIVWVWFNARCGASLEEEGSGW